MLLRCAEVVQNRVHAQQAPKRMRGAPALAGCILVYGIFPGSGNIYSESAVRIIFIQGRKLLESITKIICGCVVVRGERV